LGAAATWLGGGGDDAGGEYATKTDNVNVANSDDSVWDDVFTGAM
jgi:hypothetical protein